MDFPGVVAVILARFLPRIINGSNGGIAHCIRSVTLTQISTLLMGPLARASMVRGGMWIVIFEGQEREEY